MINLPSGTRVLLATRPIDFRKDVAFRWPPIMDGVMKLSPVEFAALFDGLDWTRVQTTKGILKPSVAA
jgi:hypothetical protein